MATREAWAARPIEDRLERLRRTPDELAGALRDRDDTALARRPDPRNWAAKEVVCHLRDIEELCLLRYRAMLAMEEPKVFVAGARPRDPEAWGLAGAELAIDPDRWAEERQYLRCDAPAALSAFRRRREESLAFLDRLTPAQWSRACLHPTLGRLTFADWTALVAAHDDNHLDQLRRALEGRT